MFPRSCFLLAASKSNSSTLFPRTTTTRVSSGWEASISILLAMRDSQWLRYRRSAGSALAPARMKRARAREREAGGIGTVETVSRARLAPKSGEGCVCKLVRKRHLNEIKRALRPRNESAGCLSTAALTLLSPGPEQHAHAHDLDTFRVQTAQGLL